MCRVIVTPVAFSDLQILVVKHKPAERENLFSPKISNFDSFSFLDFECKIRLLQTVQLKVNIYILMYMIHTVFTNRYRLLEIQRTQMSVFNENRLFYISSSSIYGH